MKLLSLNVDSVTVLKVTASNEDLSAQLQRMWSFDSIGIKSPDRSADDDLAFRVVRHLVCFGVAIL